MALSEGTRLGPYEILSPLGVGGMGEVYRARDLKLKRDVAIKVLPQSLAGDPEALARFEREALAVAALSHPNILSIHDFGTHGGVAYAVMELLEGETLRAKLDFGPIPQKQVVDYGLQIAKGLSAAHEKGVVHRDLKPENLFVTKDGHLKILDFGLAKRVEAVEPGKETSAPTASGHTQPGRVMGTVGYMSPEQVRGLPVDHRSDIFSLGAILYEMLSGRKAFQRDTAADTMSAILKEEPPELSVSGRNISPALDHIVSHCLEKDRDNRFQSARDIAFALSEASGPAAASRAPARKSRALLAAVVVAALIVAGLFLVRRFPRGASEAAGVKRVAVLPFENVGAPEDDYFADGMSDEVRGKLTTLKGVQVIARGSSTPYRKTTKTPQQIAEELGVGYLLTATVRWQKAPGGTSRVVVSPELVEVSGSGAPTSKWQQPFDTALTDVFKVQSDIATRVAQSLGVALGATEERRLEATPTQNLAAYDAFLKGEAGWMTNFSARTSQGFYEQAVALDPGFAQAWARLAQAISVMYDGSPTPEAAELARKAAERAMALASESPEAHLAMGYYESFVRNDHSRALEQYVRGQRVSPNNAEILTARANAEGALGQTSAALQHLQQAERLDPRSVLVKLNLGATLISLHRPSDAREALDRGLALAPANVNLIRFKAMAYLAEGDLERARAVVKATPKDVEPTVLVANLATYLDLVWLLDDDQRDLLLRMPPSAFDNVQETWSLCLAQASALKGDQGDTHAYAEKTRRTLQAQLGVTPQAAQSHALLGLALAYLGQKKQAIEEGERALALTPATRDAFSNSYYRHQLVRIYILAGEPEKALDELGQVLGSAYILTPGWLKIDPNFDPLRKNPRFQKLVAGAK